MKKGIAIALGAAGIFLSLISIFFKVKKSIAISVIGGADGPTSIFMAGRLGRDHSTFGIAIGLILILVSALILLRKSK